MRVSDESPVFYQTRFLLFAIRSNCDRRFSGETGKRGGIQQVEHGSGHCKQRPEDLRDYSVIIIIKCSVLEQYPVTDLQELLTKLSGGKKFTKIDLSQADQCNWGLRQKAECTPQLTVIQNYIKRIETFHLQSLSFKAPLKTSLKTFRAACATLMTSWFLGKLIKRNPPGQRSPCVSDYKLTLCEGA